VKLDLSDAAARQELFARIGAAGRNVLTVTEGLLVYLTPEQVGSLASDLRRHPSFRWWIIDLVSPALLRMLQRRYGPKLSAGGAPLRFGPEEGIEFFRRFGWRAAEVRSSFEEGRRLRRQPPLAWLFRLAACLTPPGKRIVGSLALLERA
ncbi:MAG: class I SAM-dependent methyltransferase, partial [Thermoanaerobaculia bacterium]